VSIDNFVPEIWSKELLVNLQKNLVFAQEGVVNRDYEGEIQEKGDTVHINSIGPVTIFDYDEDTFPDPEQLNDAQTNLVITQAKAFNFKVKDVDAAQTSPKVMAAAMNEAGYGLRDVADQFLAALYTGVAGGNTIGDDVTPIVPTKADAYEYLVDLDVMLTDAKIPTGNRWVSVPGWFHGLLRKDDRFVKTGSSQAEQILRNGEVGEAAGFRVLVSHNTPNTAGALYKIIAGYPGAITYAEQINKVEAYRPEKGFSDAVKGLHLYGGKLVRPDGIAVLTADKS